MIHQAVLTFHFTDEKIAQRSSHLSKITLSQYVPKVGFKSRYSLFTLLFLHCFSRDKTGVQRLDMAGD